MAEIVEPLLDVGSIVGVAPADGIVSALADDGSIVVLEAWDSVQGDAIHTAPAGSAIGGGTRRHLFDREVYVDSGGGAYVNVRAWGSITGTPTTVQGYGITNGIRNDQNGTIAGTLGVTSVNVTGGSSGQGKVWFSAADGLIVQAKTGSGNDLSLYTPGAGYIMRVTTGGAATAWGGNMIPISDAGNDFGGSSNRWRHGYFSGTVTVNSLTYAGVSVNAAATGTGNLVLSASPTFTGTVVAAAIAATTVSVTSTQAAHAANKGALEYTSGFTQIRSWGTDAATRGGLQVVLLASDGTLSTTALSLTGTGAVFAGAVSGITTLAASGTVTLTKQGAFGLVVDAGVSTSFAGISFRSNNSAGIGWLYNENSGGGNVTGSAANSLVLATVTAAPVHIGYNGVVSVTFGAGGAVTVTGAITPATDNAVDHGGSSNRWRDGYYGRNVTIGGTLGVTGTISGGASTWSSTMTNTGGAIVISSGGAAALSLKSATGSSARTDHYVNNVLLWQAGAGVASAGRYEIYDTVNGVQALSFIAGATPSAQFSARVGIGAAADAAYGLLVQGAAALKIMTSAGGENGLLVANASLNVWRFTASTLQIFGTLDVNGDIIAETDAANDVGTVSHRFRDGYFSRDLTIGGTLTVGSFTLPAASWTAATMLNSWTGQAYYWKDPFGIVHLSSPGGLVLNNNGAIVFVLPAGYRPSATIRFSIHTANLAGTQIVGYCEVDTSGNVRCDNGTGYQNYTHIDGLSFAT